MDDQSGGWSNNCLKRQKGNILVLLLEHLLFLAIIYYHNFPSFCSILLLARMNECIDAIHKSPAKLIKIINLLIKTFVTRKLWQFNNSVMRRQWLQVGLFYAADTTNLSNKLAQFCQQPRLRQRGQNLKEIQEALRWVEGQY